MERRDLQRGIVFFGPLAGDFFFPTMPLQQRERCHMPRPASRRRSRRRSRHASKRTGSRHRRYRGGETFIVTEFPHFGEPAKAFFCVQERPLLSGKRSRAFVEHDEGMIQSKVFVVLFDNSEWNVVAVRRDPEENLVSILGPASPLFSRKLLDDVEPTLSNLKNGFVFDATDLKYVTIVLQKKRSPEFRECSFITTEPNATLPSIPYWFGERARTPFEFHTQITNIFNEFDMTDVTNKTLINDLIDGIKLSDAEKADIVKGLDLT